MATRYNGGQYAQQHQGLGDPQRAWDRSVLSNMLADMQVSVEATNQALTYKDNVMQQPYPSGRVEGGSAGGYADEQAAYGGGQYGNGQQQQQQSYGQDGGDNMYNDNSNEGYGDMDGAVAQVPAGYGAGAAAVPQAPVIDYSQLPIVEGFVHKKVTSFIGRSWKDRFLRLEGTALAFYLRPEDADPKEVFTIDANTIVVPNDASKVHRNKSVKFDFDLTNGSNETVSLYCASGEESFAWQDTVNIVVDVIRAQAEQAIQALQQQPQQQQVGAGGQIQQQQQQQQYADNNNAQGYDDYADNAAYNDAAGNAYGGGAQQQQQDNGYGGSDGGYEQNDMGGADGNGYSVTGGGGPVGGSVGGSGDAGGMGGQVDADYAQCHTAYGTGLYEAVRGEPACFYVQAHTDNGVPKNVGGDNFTVTIEAADLHFELLPVDNQDGTYYCEYTPTRAGEYELTVKFNGHDIYGSPFHPVVSRAPTAASHCRVVGEGATVARVGVTNTFTIVARDQFDDERGVGGDAFELEIHGPGLANPIIDHMNGVYTVSYDIDTDHKAYQAYASGSLDGKQSGSLVEIHVSLNNEGFAYPRPVAGSPFRPRVLLPGDAGVLLAQLEDRKPASASAAAAPASSGAASSAHPSIAAAQALVASLRNAAAGLSGAMAAAAPVSSSSAAALSSVSNPSEPDDIRRMRAELAAKDAEMAARLAAMDELQRRLEADRAAVDLQMQRMTELGRRVKEDSDKLADQARALRAVAVGATPLSPAAAAVSSSASAAASAANNLAGVFASNSSSSSNSDVPPPPPPPRTSKPVAASINASVVADNVSVGATEYTVGGMTATTAGGSLHHPAPPSKQASSQPKAAPIELSDPSVVALFDRYKRQLQQLWGYFASVSAPGIAGAPAMDCKRFVELFVLYDIAPTFLGRRELKSIYAAASKNSLNALESEDGTALPLSYSAFVEALGRTALISLSKPAFKHLYPRAPDKVAVLLEMWGLGDAGKLQEVQQARAQRA